MAMTPESRALLIHAAAYVVVNAALLVVNATQTLEPGETRSWWVIWVIAGWGIGLAAHAFAVWMERNAREGQLLADPDARGVALHLFVYLAVNTLLVVVNFTTSPETLWSIWPILIWGVALAVHAYLAYRAVLRKTMQRYATEQEILSQMQLERRAAEIAAAIAPQETTEQSEADEGAEPAEEPAPVEEPMPAEAPAPVEEPAPAPKRKRAAAKTTRRTTRKTTRKTSAKKPAAKTTRSPARKTTRSKSASSRTARTRKPTARKPASKTGEKS